MSFQTIYYINNGASEHFRPLLCQELSEPPFNARKYFGAPPLTEKIFWCLPLRCPPIFLRITSPIMNLLDRSFLKQFKTFGVRVLSDLNTRFRLHGIFISDKTLLLMF
jgi:hypothetical protein